jgi:hypothetical protein|tara:strand:- start:438 stop:635 length:198 start_codon:yes stop_codon:yes gene_type:complete
MSDKKKRTAPLWVVALLAIVAAASVAITYRDGEIGCEASVDTEALLETLEDADDDSADDDSAEEE